MSAYAESSGVLAWLLDEAPASEIRQLLIAAEAVVSSDLTLIECDRVLLRAAVLGELTKRKRRTAVHTWPRRRLIGTYCASVRKSSSGRDIRFLENGFERPMPFTSRPFSWRDRPSRDSSCSAWTIESATPRDGRACESVRNRPRNWRARNFLSPEGGSHTGTTNDEPRPPNCALRTANCGSNHQSA